MCVRHVTRELKNFLRKTPPVYILPILRTSTFQYDTGQSLAMSEMTFASEPTSMRGSRRSMPRTIVSPATDGGSRKSFLYFA